MIHAQAEADSHKTHNFPSSNTRPTPLAASSNFEHRNVLFRPSHGNNFPMQSYLLDVFPSCRVGWIQQVSIATVFAPSLLLESVNPHGDTPTRDLILMVEKHLSWTAVAMNASRQVTSPELARTVASVATAFRQRFPDGRADLCPWRDDWRTRHWEQPNSIDLGFHFPGWSPRLACRSVLVQLQFKTPPGGQGQLLGLVLRGISFRGEQWRLATLGPWQPEGKDTPTEDVSRALQHFCRDVFKLFGAVAN